MFFGFEGTGLSMAEGRAGLNDLSNTKSFIWKAYEAANFLPLLKKYFPGPNVQGNNCDLILKDAIDFFNTNKSFEQTLSRITIFGYSRGAYIGMCLAKYLEKEGYSVFYLGLFDAVSQDFERVVERGYGVSVEKVSLNVKKCYQASRSRLVGSRNSSMNYIGETYENGSMVNYLVCPGSHASMGGFPNEAGLGDKPLPNFGNPNHPTKFDPKREFTAWYNSENHVITPALGLKLIKHNLIPRIYSNNELIPQSKWDWNNQRLYGSNAR